MNKELPERQELKINPYRSIFVLIPVILLMCACSVLATPIAFEDSAFFVGLVLILLGIMGIVMAIGVAIFAFKAVFREHKMSIILTHDNFEYVTEGSHLIIPWEDIEEIGMYKENYFKFNGIRLNTYENILDISSEQLQKENRTMKITSRFAAVALFLGSAAGGDGKHIEDLSSLVGVDNLVKSLLWSRENKGYELVFGYGHRTQSAKEFDMLLRSYWKRKLQINSLAID